MAEVATTDEMLASVNATLAQWRSATEVSNGNLRKKRITEAIDSDAQPTDVSNRTTASSPQTTAKDLQMTSNESRLVDDIETITPCYHAKSTLSDDKKKSYFTPNAFRRRLSTFRPATYFAKPLALSPLVCAAFGWENTKDDMIRCCYPGCNAVICVSFHPEINEESRDRVCEAYLNMLATSHKSGEAVKCPFQSYAQRWLKIMRKYRCDNVGEPTTPEPAKKDDVGVDLHGYVIGNTLSFSKSNIYVPPYFLSLSDSFLMFEDCSCDGSVTRDIVKKSATRLYNDIKVALGRDTKSLSEAEWDVTFPESVNNFCDEVSGGNMTFFNEQDNTLKVARMLSTFGWNFSEVLTVGDGKELIFECSLCLSRALLVAPTLQRFEAYTGSDFHEAKCVPADEPRPNVAQYAEEPKRKRNFHTYVEGQMTSEIAASPSTTSRNHIPSDASIKLIDSHRIYCPFASGFALHIKQSRLPGWKVILTNLLKSPP